jgi:putative tricarboxylic transport membrane protein
MTRVTTDAAAGLFLIAFGAWAWWLGAELTAGTLNQLGPGMLPRALSVLLGLCGVALLVDGLVTRGEALQRWDLRGPLFLLGAAVLFGFSVRPLGLAVAAPVAVMVGAMASPETRWGETLAFAAVLTLFCLLLFKIALSLPIPVLPWLIGY